MRIRLWTACMAIVAVVAGASPASASAATITFDMPFNEPVTNECTGETLHMKGTAHFKVTDNSSLAGLKSQIEMNTTGVQGTTVTGVRYVSNDQTSDMQHAEFEPFGNAQITMEQSTILNRQGETGALLIDDDGDDSRLHVIVHLTVTNGVTRASKFEVRSDCR